MTNDALSDRGHRGQVRSQNAEVRKQNAPHPVPLLSEERESEARERSQLADGGGRTVGQGPQRPMTKGEWRVRAGKGQTSLYIYPGYEWKVVGALLTNFHLPRSTLLMLASAFAGREAVLAAYRHAIEQRYRFYSFGDAMLIV